MEEFKVVAALITLAFALISTIVILTSNRIIVGPKEAAIIHNPSTGKMRVFFAGVHFPGPTWALFQTISLRNEPSQKLNEIAIASSLLRLGVVYNIRKFQVIPNAESIIKAATEIEYPKRRELAKAQIAAATARVIGRMMATRETLSFEQADIENIEVAVNRQLAERLSEPWGLAVELDIAFVGLPGRVHGAVVAEMSAQKEGEAIRKKADAAGVSPTIVTVAEAARGVLRNP